MVMAWRYTHTRVEPHSNMTRLEQCDGVSYGHDRASIAQWYISYPRLLPKSVCDLFQGRGFD